MSNRNVVFVHGLIGSFSEPATFLELGEGVSCSAPDLAGYGRDAGRGVSTAGQVARLRDHVEALGGPAHLVAHSIGAVYAFELADARPDLVESVTSVEGNFSLDDAFWSRSIAELGADDARRRVQALLGDPQAFLAGDGITSTREAAQRALAALSFQPWSTVWESARAVVGTTSRAEYQETIARVFEAVPVYLVAGERSASGWGVPDWARTAAAGSVVMPGVGHMMMLESPREFGALLARLWE
jgi:lipase